ncbi:hypothetical protein ACFL6D_05260, partial [Spirochaetota bacterium]
LYLSLIPGTGAAYFDDVSVIEQSSALISMRMDMTGNNKDQIHIKKIYNMSLENTVDFSPILKDMSINPNDTIKVCVYDIQGKLIRNVYNGNYLDNREIKWDLLTTNNEEPKTGVYVYTICVSGEKMLSNKKGVLLFVK